MGLRINTNVASLVAQRNLNATTLKLEGNFRRLSTGKRIATAADDAAGLGISARLSAQVRSLQQASRNAGDGISLAQTAEGSLADIGTALTRARELATQAANGTLQGSDKDALQAEFSQILTSIDQIANSTSFNGVKLLNGTTSSLTLQIGEGVTAGTDTFSVTLSSALSSALSIDTLNIGSTGNASAAITALDSAINSISTQRAALGAVQNTLNGTISSINNRVENLSAANSRIVDVDLAVETAELTKHSILQSAGLSVLAQANAQSSSALRLLQGL
jgi:flagellin